MPHLDAARCGKCTQIVASEKTFAICADYGRGRACGREPACFTACNDALSYLGNIAARAQLELG